MQKLECAHSARSANTVTVWPRLKDLRGSGLVELATVGGARRYRLTPRGESLRPVLQALFDRGDANADALGARIAPPAGE